MQKDTLPINRPIVNQLLEAVSLPHDEAHGMRPNNYLQRAMKVARDNADYLTIHDLTQLAIAHALTRIADDLEMQNDIMMEQKI
jgi:hypothetical protein